MIGLLKYYGLAIFGTDLLVMLALPFRIRRPIIYCIALAHVFWFFQYRYSACEDDVVPQLYNKFEFSYTLFFNTDQHTIEDTREFFHFVQDSFPKGIILLDSRFTEPIANVAPLHRDSVRAALLYCNGAPIQFDGARLFELLKDHVNELPDEQKTGFINLQDRTYLDAPFFVTKDNFRQGFNYQQALIIAAPFGSSNSTGIVLDSESNLTRFGSQKTYDGQLLASLLASMRFQNYVSPVDLYFYLGITLVVFFCLDLIGLIAARIKRRIVAYIVWKLMQLAVTATTVWMCIYLLGKGYWVNPGFIVIQILFFGELYYWFIIDPRPSKRVRHQAPLAS